MNQTMLDMALLHEEFKKHFDDGYVIKYWFAKLLHSSTIMGIMGDYRNFGELAGVALDNLFFEHDKPLSLEQKNQILGVFKNLPAYEDVEPAIMLLKQHGIRAIAVSNSSLSMIKEQLSNAHILDLFDSYYSVDMVRNYKPFKDIYHSVANAEQLNPEEVMMIATHDWDLFGAKMAGLQTGYIERKKTIYNPLYSQADYQASSLTELVSQFLDIDN